MERNITVKNKHILSGKIIFAVLLVMPVLLVLLLLVGFPMVYSFVISFFNWDLISQPKFIGLVNYIHLLSSMKFLNSILITLVFTAFSFAIEFITGFGIALLLNQDIRGKRYFRSMILVPMMLTPVVIGVTWRMLYNQEFGLINYVFTIIGLKPVGWVTNSNVALIAVSIAEIWHMTAYVILILSAGLASLPEEPFEAASIDGAGWWQKLRYIMIPLLKPLIILICIFRVIELFRIFDMVYTLTGGGPGRSTETLSFSVYIETFTGWQIGYGAAASYIIVIITACIGCFLLSKEEKDF